MPDFNPRSKPLRRPKSTHSCAMRRRFVTIDKSEATIGNFLSLMSVLRRPGPGLSDKRRLPAAPGFA